MSTPVRFDQRFKTFQFPAWHLTPRRPVPTDALRVATELSELSDASPDAWLVFLSRYGPLGASALHVRGWEDHGVIRTAVALPYRESAQWLTAHARTMRWCLETERTLRIRLAAERALTARLEAMPSPVAVGPILQDREAFQPFGKPYDALSRLRNALSQLLGANVRGMQLVVSWPSNSTHPTLSAIQPRGLIEACYMAVAQHFSGGGRVVQCAAPDCAKLFLSPDPRARYCRPADGKSVSACANRARVARHRAKKRRLPARSARIR